MTREQAVTETLVQLADTLVSEYDAAEMFYFLVESCRSVLGVDQAGLMLIDSRGDLQVVAATSETTHVLEVLQIQNEQGPCLDAARSGRPVISGALHGADAVRRWPRLAEAATQAGFTAITALPMRLRQTVLGALNLFFVEQRPPQMSDIAVAQAFADIGTIAILQDRATHDAKHLIDQLQRALDTRIVLEQAKGRVAEHSQMDMDAAFTSIRAYARDRNLRLSDIARDLVDGVLDPSVFQIPVDH